MTLPTAVRGPPNNALVRTGPVGLVAADWGTSSLRVWAISPTGVVMAERRSDEGMARLQPDGFEPVLRQHLATLGIAMGETPLPVLLCGMVGARQGWRQADYVDVPTRLDALYDHVLAIPAPGLDVRVMPGLADQRPEREDVMRGEETLLLGMLQPGSPVSGLVCLPGTHSKWVRLQDDEITGFSTAMTGEMFAVLGQHSVLRHSLNGAKPSGNPHAPAFLRGVGIGLAEPERLTMALFGLRSATLLRGASGTTVADMLSGLLIGAEIAAAGVPDGAAVTLIAEGSLAALYEGALALAGHATQIVEASSAVRAGLLLAARQIWPGQFA